MKKIKSNSADRKLREDQNLIIERGCKSF